MRQSKNRTKKNFKLVDSIKKAFKPRTDFENFKFDSKRPDDVCPEKWALLNIVLKDAHKNCPWIAKMIENGEVELVGLNQRVTYNKMHKDEDMAFTHIFDNPCILLKVKKNSMLIIYGEHIVYENKFIDG